MLAGFQLFLDHATNVSTTNNPRLNKLRSRVAVIRPIAYQLFQGHFWILYKRLQYHILIKRTSEKLSKMLRSYLALIFLISSTDIYVNAVTVNFQDCGSQSAKVVGLDLQCNDGAPFKCIFQKGQEYKGKVNFHATAGITGGNIVLHAIVEGVKMPFPFDKPNICENHNLTCPILSGSNQELTIDIKVPSFAPSVNLEAKFEIQSSSNTEVMCFNFLGEIVNNNEITV